MFTATSLKSSWKIAKKTVGKNQNFFMGIGSVYAV